MNRKLIVTASLAAFFGVVAMQATHGATLPSSQTMYLTFSGPVSLPGVALGTGTYLFERASPDGPAFDVVRVLSPDRRRVYFQGFTLAVDRPAGMHPGQVVTIGEAPAGAPTPIKAWYPEGETLGHQFIWTGLRNR